MDIVNEFVKGFSQTDYWKSTRQYKDASGNPIGTLVYAGSTVDDCIV